MDLSALIGNRFRPYFQPIVHLETGKIGGFEVLSRIVEPDGSIQSPGQIIAKIEQDLELFHQLMVVIFLSINRTVVPLFERYRGFYVSINIPPAFFGEERIGYLFNTPRLIPHLNRFVIEMTERQAMTEKGRSAIQFGRDHGVAIAVDDFGTGESGLAQIAGVELDILKIDGSLIRPVLSNTVSARMIRGLVALSAALRMHTVAECVETGEQAFFLRGAGVEYGQGWFWSKAVPEEEIETMLKKDRGSVLNPS